MLGSGSVDDVEPVRSTDEDEEAEEPPEVELIDANEPLMETETLAELAVENENDGSRYVGLRRRSSTKDDSSSSLDKPKSKSVQRQALNDRREEVEKPPSPCCCLSAHNDRIQLARADLHSHPCSWPRSSLSSKLRKGWRPSDVATT